MSLSATRSRLAALTREFSVRWNETREVWNDAKSREFEHQMIEGLFPHVDRAVSALEQLDELLARIRKDCE